MVITNVNQVVYQGDGVTTAFPFTFRIIDWTDIKLLLLDSDGTETDITSDYYVDTENDTVHYPGYAPGAEPALSDRPPVLAEGQKLVIYRKLPITQEKDLGDKWPFYVIELGLDKLTMILQDIWDWLGRCLYVSKGQAYEAGDDFDPTIPLEADKVICGNANATGYEAREALMEVNGAWDGEGRQIKGVADPTSEQDAVTKKYADTRMDDNFMKLQPDGTAWEGRNLPISNVAGPALVKDAANKDYVDRILAGYSGYGERLAIFDNVAQMQAAELVPSQMAVTLGYHDVNDGGAGVYTIRDIGADTPDGGSIIEITGTDFVAELITDGTVNVKQFGAKGDGVTDDTAAFLNAIATNKKVVIPLGTFVLTDTLTLPVGGEIYGLGYGSILKIQHDNVGFLLKDGYRGNHIHDFQVNGGSDGVFAFDVKRPQCTFEHIYFEGYTGDGFNIGNGDSTGGYATWINGVKFVGNKDAENISRKYALYIDVNGGLIVVNECNFSLCNRAVSIYTCAGFFMTKSNVSECNAALIPTTEGGGTGFYLKGGNTILIKDSYLENMGRLMDMDGATNVCIEGCYINLLAQSTTGVRIISGEQFTIKNSFFKSTYTTAKAIVGENTYGKTITVIDTVFDCPTDVSAINAVVIKREKVDASNYAINFGTMLFKGGRTLATEIDSSTTNVGRGSYISTGTVNITLTTSSVLNRGGTIEFFVATGTLTVIYPRAYGYNATITMTEGQGCKIIKRSNGYYAAFTSGTITT